MTNIYNEIDDNAAEFAGYAAKGSMSYEEAHEAFTTAAAKIAPEMEYDYFCERWDEIYNDVAEQWEEYQEYMADQDY